MPRALTGLREATASVPQWNDHVRLAALDQRERVSQEAEQAAANEVRRQRELAAVSEAAQLSTAILLRLRDGGIEATEHDAAHIALAAHTVVRNDPDIAEVEAAREIALEEVERISERIGLLNERAVALQSLRFTDQSAPRDLAEAATIERDLDTLRNALASAEARARAAKVPDELREMRRRAMEALSAYEVHVATRTLHERVHAAELAYLDSIRNLLAGTGSRTAVGVYRRGAEFDRFVRYGAL
jgi:hypothetical protein